MEYDELLELVYDTATEFTTRGPGWALQATVLSEVACQIKRSEDLRVQELILTCWHDLFRLGRLSWGSSLDNPNAPFYHVPERDKVRNKVREKVRGSRP